MNRAQRIRIAGLLMVIFAAGVVTGRLTARKPPTLVPTATGQLGTAENALIRLGHALTLSPQQERQFRRLFEEMAEPMSKLPPSSQQRLELFRRYIPRMEALLQPSQ